MDASNRVGKRREGPSKAQRRPGGPRRPAPRDNGTPVSQQSADGEQVLVEPPTADSLMVTVRVIPLPDPETNPLRARQLAVIVDLLRRAAAKAVEEDATPSADAESNGK